MKIQDECLGRHAAVLHVVADQLRTLEATHEGGSLDQCTFAIEAVASALICAELSRAETL